MSPLSPISFIFMQFLVKIWSNNRFWPQIQGLAPPSEKSWIRHRIPCSLLSSLLSRLQIKQFSNAFVSDMDNRRYLLKAPHHLLSLQALTDVFPQAQLVFTYRNLSQVIPSFLSLASTFTEQYGGVLDRKWRKR